MEKTKPSYWWALPIGLVFPVFHLGFYYLRFSEFDPFTPWLDYLWYFAAGVVGTLFLVFLLHRSKTSVQKWIVAVAFLLGTPISTLAMAGASGFGPIGIILFPMIIWALFSGFGFLVGWYFSRRLVHPA